MTARSTWTTRRALAVDHEQVAALLDQRLRHRVVEAAHRQHRLDGRALAPVWPMASSATRRTVTGRPASGCLEKSSTSVSDQRVGAAGHRHRQVGGERRQRLGLDREAVAAVGAAGVEGDLGAGGGDAVVVLRLVGESGLAGRGALEAAEHRDGRGRVGLHGEGPASRGVRRPGPSVTAPLAATAKLAEAMPGRGLGERGRRAAGDGLVEGEAARRRRSRAG